MAITLPRLCERREDIPALINHILAVRQLGNVRYQVDPAALSALTHYHWPGNVRELVNVLERAQILAEDNTITLDDLPEALAAQPNAPLDAGPLNLAALECQTVHSAMQQCKSNKVQAAKALGISRRTLYRLLEKYQMETKVAGQPDAVTDSK
jgi:DNA-binding NtrC family response regulator